MARWLEKLSEFDFVIEHRPGRPHVNADGLSRVPHLEDEEEDKESTQNIDDNGLDSPILTTYNITRTGGDNWASRWSNNELDLFHEREDPVLNEVIISG